jgi:hypothetical protein
MNYIPGFSNYLAASVPRYARGGQVMDDMEFSDYGLGGPMLGAEAVGFDLANPMLGGPEQGGSYTGGMGGGPSRTAEERAASILDVNPYVAPSADMNPDPITSQRNGDQLGYYFANELGLPARYGGVGSPQPADPATFDPNAQYEAPMPGFVPVDPDATYRLVNGGANGEVVYAGAGGEGLRNVFEQANQLTMDNPKNAYWGVEVLDPATGQYKRVAENQGPNGLGIVGDIAGVALPVAAAIATGGASLGVQIAAGAAAGGLGGFLAGNDPLKSALISGVTAGLGNVTGFNEAVGGALSNAGDAVKNAFVPELAKKAATEAGGDIVVNALSGLAKGVGGGALQGATSAVTSGGSPTPAQPTPTQPAPTEPPAYEPINYGAVDPIVVTGGGSTTGLDALAGLGGGITASLPALGGLAADPFLSQPTPDPEPITEEQYADEPIVVKAYRPINPVGGFDPTSVSKDLIGLGGSVAAGLPALTELAMDPTLTQPEPATEDIVVTGTKAVPKTVVPDVLTAVGPSLPALTELAMDPTLAEPATEDIVVTGNKAIPKTVVPEPIFPVTPILPQLDIPQVPSPDPALTDKKKLGLEEYLRLLALGIGAVDGKGGSGSPGTYVPGGRGLNPIFSAKLPTANIPGGVGAASNLGARQMGDVDWLTYGQRPELSFYNYVPKPTGMAEGGAFAAKHGGQSSRSEFAVNGPGTGRSDDIPAVLSDGEYVIDAETVALLGDGSSKAGAKKLDDLRVKVRKHKGQKLAKGRFSANAKKPEAYLSGGRI